jgi:hypothetical protein
MSFHSCFLKYVAFRKEPVVDVACAAFMDLDDKVLLIAATTFLTDTYPAFSPDVSLKTLC